MHIMSRSFWAGLLTVFVLAAALRVGWVAARHARQLDALNFPDEQAYLLAAQSLAAGNGLIDEFGYRATYMPGYPAFIAVFLRLGLPLLVLRVVQALLGALVAPATFLLAHRWANCILKGSGGGAALPVDDGLRTRIAWLAGVLAACDPFLIFFSGLLLTEALFTVALVVFWWLVLELIDPERASWALASIGAGVCLLAAIMLRPSSMILLMVAPLVVLCLGRFRVSSWLRAGVLVAVVMAGLFPWAARNARILGEWRWTTTRGGISLYDGVQPGATGASDLAHTKLDPAVAGLDELAWDRHWHEQAVAAIREDPGRILTLAGRKFLRTWNIIPNEENSRRGTVALISGVWVTGILLACVAGLWRVRGAVRWWLMLLAPVLAFTLVHMVYIGSVRYRIPLMPFLFVLGAAGVRYRRSTGDARS
jgi:hypothetical protein